MPLIKSAIKDLKQNLKKRSRNKHFTALYKEATKSLENALESSSPKLDEAKTLLSKVYSCIDKLVKKNIIHDNNWAHRKSKYAKLLKSVSLKKS